MRHLTSTSHTTRCQFHQHFMRRFLYEHRFGRFFYVCVTREKLLKRCSYTKKLYGKCWWNWLQVKSFSVKNPGVDFIKLFLHSVWRKIHFSISPTFFFLSLCIKLWLKIVSFSPNALPNLWAEKKLLIMFARKSRARAYVDVIDCLCQFGASLT